MYNLWVLMAQTRHLTYQVRSKSLQSLGITPRQAAVLHIIPLIGEKATPAEISRWVGRESHTVSSNLNTMEKQGLIKKTKNLEKKNLIRISLTEKGRKIAAQSMKSDFLQRLFGDLSEEERRQFRKILEKIQDTAVEELDMKNKSPHF